LTARRSMRCCSIRRLRCGLGGQYQVCRLIHRDEFIWSVHKRAGSGSYRLSVAMIWHALRTRNILQLVLFPARYPGRGLRVHAQRCKRASAAFDYSDPDGVCTLEPQPPAEGQLPLRHPCWFFLGLWWFSRWFVIATGLNRVPTHSGSVLHAGACDQGKELILSLYQRDASLGLNEERLKTLNWELDKACEAGEEREKPKNQSNWNERIIRPLEDTALAYLEGVIYRALVIPTQVAAWHLSLRRGDGIPRASPQCPSQGA
jgi:hypothetical protein